MGVQDNERPFCVLPRQTLLLGFEIAVRQIRERICRIRISESDELQDFLRRLFITGALVIEADDAGADRP